MLRVMFDCSQAKYTSTALTAATPSHNTSTIRRALFIVNGNFSLYLKDTIGIEFLVRLKSFAGD
jgi:hypothetical protein